MHQDKPYNPGQFPGGGVQTLGASVRHTQRVLSTDMGNTYPSHKGNYYYRNHTLYHIGTLDPLGYIMGMQGIWDVRSLHLHSLCVSRYKPMDPACHGGYVGMFKAFAWGYGFDACNFQGLGFRDFSFKSNT